MLGFLLILNINCNLGEKVIHNFVHAQYQAGISVVILGFLLVDLQLATSVYLALEHFLDVCIVYVLND